MTGAYFRYAAVQVLLLVAHAHGADAAKIPTSTSDILRLAGLEKIPQHEEPPFIPQAAKTKMAVRKAALAGHKSVCESEDWRKKSLKLVREIPLAGILGELEEETKFEASAIALGLNDQYYVACDNTRTLLSVNEQLQFKSNLSRLVRDETPGVEARRRGVSGLQDSQFEGITYMPAQDHFLVVKEQVEHGDHYHPVVQEIALSDDGESYTMLQNCTVDFELEHANKGFEGIQYHKDSSGDKWLLGLCEGNFCSGGKHGRKKGNGRIVASKFYQNEDLEVCGWEPKKVIEIPENAYFADYSGMVFRGSRLAITSQEDSEVWIGEFDKEKLEFTSNGEHYHFPRSDYCEQIYCNIEGVEWIDDDRLMLASDRAKADQPYICTVRDQSVHIMLLPHGHRKDAAAAAAAADAEL